MKSTSSGTNGRVVGAESPWRDSWAGIVWTLLFVVAGAVLCFVPLFNVLGYESSLVLAILASVAGVRQGVRAVVRGRGGEGALGHGAGPASGRPGGRGAGRHSGRPGSRAGRGVLAGDRASEAPLAAVVTLFVRAFVGVLLPLLLPLLLLLLNGLRVRNCSYGAGLAFFVMLPVLSGACAAGVGVVAGLASDRPGGAYVAGYGVLVASLAWSLWRFLAAPAIFSFDPFFGYYPGALYDEEVAIGMPFLAARALHMALLMATLWGAALLLHGDTLTVEGPWRGRVGHRRHIGSREGDGGRGGLFLSWLLVSVVAGALLWGSGRLGGRGDRAALRRHLTAEVRTPHFVLRYRPGGAVAHDIQLLAREHELRYAQLRTLLGVEPLWRTPGWARLIGLDEEPVGADGAPRVVSYLFDTLDEKRRLMGAGYTYIAKPWRREMYLHHEAWPHPVLRHELAHIFGGAVGDRLLRLASRYGLPQPGMVEGFAVAADWRSSGDLDVHQVVRAMRHAGLEPPLASVFSLRFYRLPSSIAYTVAGSFCRYLLTNHGAGPLLDAYRRGGMTTDFAAAYGRPFADLERDWRRFIDGKPVADSDREVARERLRRPAVFHKVCAHELAVRKAQARSAAAGGDFDTALRLLSSVCSDDPGEPAHAAERMELLLSAEQFEDAERAAQALLGHPARTGVLESRAQARLGDLAVLRGDLATARRYYTAAAALPDSEGALRQTVAKLTMLGGPEGAARTDGTPTAAGAGAPEPGAAVPPQPIAATVATVARDAVLRVLVGEPLSLRAGRMRRNEGRGDALSVYLLRDAITAQPELGLPHYILGRLLYDRGGYDEAQTELGLSLSAGLPDERFVYQAMLLRGQAALLAGRAGEAAQILSELRDRVAAAGGASAASPSTGRTPGGGRLLDVEDMLDRARLWDTLPRP